MSVWVLSSASRGGEGGASAREGIPKNGPDTNHAFPFELCRYATMRLLLNESVLTPAFNEMLLDIKARLHRIL